MNQAMVTGRMSEKKKKYASDILKKNGMNASQAINMLYDRIIEDGDVSCMTGKSITLDPTMLQNAMEFVDSLVVPASAYFDSMSKSEIKAERLRARGLL